MAKPAATPLAFRQDADCTEPVAFATHCRPCRKEGRHFRRGVLVFEMLERDGPAAGGAHPRQARLCSLADRDGTEHGLGILSDADMTDGTATVLTPVGSRRIHRVRIGMVLQDEVLARLPELAGLPSVGNRQRSSGA